MSKAVLIVNMGGPSSLSDIGDYLKSIFKDPAIIPLPGFFRNILANFISRKRTPIVSERYRLIGGKSPLPEWTDILRGLMESALRDLNKDYAVFRAFRYTSPEIGETIRSMAEKRIDEIILLPLFPHSTRAMTGSIIREAEKYCRELNIEMSAVPAWGNADEINAIWYDYIEESLEGLSGKIHVLFVAHGIPLRDVAKGDDYPVRVSETAESLGKRLPEGLTWSLAYQSKVGPVKWTGPYLQDEIKRLSESTDSLVIVPLSFVADCLETHYDLDIIASKEAKELGIGSVVRTRVFNDDPRFVRALAWIAAGGVDNA